MSCHMRHLMTQQHTMHSSQSQHQHRGAPPALTGSAYKALQLNSCKKLKDAKIAIISAKIRLKISKSTLKILEYFHCTRL